MAIDKLSKSNRLLQSRRYTHDSFTDSQEAFTSVLDINANEVYIDQSLIPTSSIPYSGSAQSGLVYSANGQNVMQYYWRQPLTRSNLSTGSAQNEVWFFLNPSGSNAGIGAQLIDSTQQTNFISPKYATPSLANATTEDTTTGYLAKVFVSNAATASGVSAGDAISVNNYTFDYKTGVLQFTSTALAPTSAQYVYVSVYQYKGRTLTDNITSVSSSIAAISASVGGGGSLGSRVASLESATASLFSDTTNLKLYTASANIRLTSLETTSASVNISVTNLNTYSASVSNSLYNLNAFTASGGNASLNSFTASAGIRLTNLETTSASVNISITNLNSFTASNANTSLNTYTSSISDPKFVSIGASTSSLNTFSASVSSSILNLNTTSASVNISVTNLNTYSASISNSIAQLNSFTSSNTSTTALNSFTASAANRLTNLETTSASVNISVTNLNTYSASVSNSIQQLNTFTASNAIVSLNTYTSSISDPKFVSIGASTSSLNSFTSSLLTALTASGVNLTANGNLTVQGNLTVAGTTTAINSQTLNIGDNIIELNYGGTATKSGIYTKDATGGSLISGSFLWDATNDYWIAGISGSESRVLVVGSMGVVSGSSQINLVGTSDYTALFGGIASATSSLNTFTASNANTSLNTYTSSISDPKFVSIGASTSSLNAFSASVSSSILNLNTYSASVSNSIAQLNSFTSSNTSTTALNSFTASAANRLTNLETTSASVNISVSNINSFTASLSPSSNVIFNNVSASAVTSSFNISAPFVSGSTTSKRIAFRDTTGKLELVPSASVAGDFVQWDGGSFIMSNTVDGGSF